MIYGHIIDSQHRWLQALESLFDDSFEDKNVINIAVVFDLEYRLPDRNSSNMACWNFLADTTKHIKGFLSPHSF